MTTLRDLKLIKMMTCPECDGAGEWDEGPINCGGAAPVDPIYRQVICPMCHGAGAVEGEAPEEDSEEDE